MKTSKTRLMELAGLREVDDIAGTYGKLNYGDFEFIKVTQQVWDKLTDIEQANAVLSAIDDTDEAEGYIGAEWDELPSAATANMKIAIKKGTSINEVDDTTMSLKSNIDQKWKTADDMAGDMQQWLSSVYRRGYTPNQGPAIYDNVMNVLSNLVDNFDPQEEDEM